MEYIAYNPLLTISWKLSPPKMRQNYIKTDKIVKNKCNKNKLNSRKNSKQFPQILSQNPQSTFNCSMSIICLQKGCQNNTKITIQIIKNIIIKNISFILKYICV